MPSAGAALEPARLAPLRSDYMYRRAEEEGYEIVGAIDGGDGAYVFEIEPRAPVGFIALPLALRIVGDASITAVGLELGWDRKRSPVWASRLALTAAKILHGSEKIPCRVVVSRLPPGYKEGLEHRGHVHFELGAEAEIRGTAQVSIVAA